MCVPVFRHTVESNADYANLLTARLHNANSKINFFPENAVEMVIRSWKDAAVVSKNFSSYI